MTPEQMRIAVAEACGWTNLHNSEPWQFSDDPDTRICLCGNTPETHWLHGDLHPVPNYPADLNACAEMEATLKLFRHRQGYYLELQCIRSRDINCARVHMQECISATALQRCEAFLRVKGLWRE